MEKISLDDDVEIVVAHYSENLDWLKPYAKNTIIYHNSPLPSSSKGGGVLYTAEGIAGVKG